MQTDLRNATLADLGDLLQRQHDSKVDVVVRADQLRSQDGNLIVPGVGTAELTETGVTSAPGALRPTEVCDGTLAAKFDIPTKYLRRIRTEGLSVPGWADLPVGPALIDQTLNAHFAADSRTVLVRGFKDENLLDVGIARAVLSDSFRAIDHLDSLTAVLAGAQRSGKQVEVQKVDLSERAMRVHFVCPEVTALAPILLRGYRSPFNDLGEDQPIVSAGFVASNSETGGGAFQIVPRFVFKICNNGLTMTKDAFRQVHLGGKLDEGIVRWSDSTLRTNVDLIAKQTADAVATFVDIDYMTKVLEGIEAKAGQPIDRPEEAIKIVAQKLRYSQDEREALMAHFIQGGQGTAGGMLNAVTSMAQTVADPDRAADIEAGAMEAFALVS